MNDKPMVGTALSITSLGKCGYEPIETIYSAAKGSNFRTFLVRASGIGPVAHLGANIFCPRSTDKSVRSPGRSRESVGPTTQTNKTFPRFPAEVVLCYRALTSADCLVLCGGGASTQPIIEKHTNRSGGPSTSMHQASGT